MKDEDKNKYTPPGDEEEQVIRAKAAVAIAHDQDRDALPRVTASGKGEAAEELVRLALEHGIPIKYDPDLVQVLSKLDLGREIPEEVFVVVAELLAFIHWVNQEYVGRYE